MASPRAVASTKALFWSLGGAVDVVAGYVHRAEPARGSALFAMGVAALAFSAGTWLAGPRMPAWGRHVLVLFAVAFCSVTVAATGGPQSAIALAGGFAFVAVDALVFYPPRQAVTYLVVAVTGCTTSLLARGDVSWAAVVVHDLVLLAPLVVVARLVRRAASAERDPLTGLANRRGFDDALDAAMSAAARSRSPLSVAVVDVDHFKDVNDTGGHTAGDQLLQTMAASWKVALPPDARAARHGGDEFAFVLPGLGGADAGAVVEALRADTTAATGVGLSCAVAQWHPGESAAKLLHRVDVALYEAKAAGRGRTALAGGQREELAADLAGALLDATGTPLTAAAERQLAVHYQPIVSLPDGVVVGIEALARWTHPVHGPISAEDFITLAEAEGLIGRLGAFVLSRACHQAAELRAATGSDLFLTVNVSGAELRAPDYPEVVSSTLRATGWPAGRLVLEVTESLIEADSAPALTALRRLDELGIGVAVDDFGTGYSALSRLDTLPATYLKLDRTFVATVTTSPSRARLVGAVCALSHALGLQLIAEGVEDPDQARALTALGAPLAQGYHFHRPQSLHDLLTALTPSGAPV